MSEKRLILNMLFESVQLENKDLIVKLKSPFENFRTLKKNEFNKNVRTLENIENSRASDVFSKNISDMVNLKVRTLKTLVIPNKKDPEGSNSLSGAGDGLQLEPEPDIYLDI